MKLLILKSQNCKQQKIKIHIYSCPGTANTKDKEMILKSVQEQSYIILKVTLIPFKTVIEAIKLVIF